MDPFARREMWKVISAALGGCSVILTTHFMEEADALCQRIGIMVNGRLCCLGSSQHLKSKYGSGYQIEISTNKFDDESTAALRAFLNGLAPMGGGETTSAMKFTEWHGGQVKCELPSKGVTLASVFDRVESSRQQLGIVDYAISQTSLETVFLSFAKLQKEDGVDEEKDITQRATAPSLVRASVNEI
jgi:ABC-type multidrug transport system ATPase subunit